MSLRSVAADGSRRLALAARQRSDDARERARDAIQRLDRAGEPVNFASVAEAAPVSRAWLYRVPELRAEIERLRTTPPFRTSRLPAAQRASIESYQRRIEALLDANRVLQDDNRSLTERLARLLGDHRAGRRGHVIDDKKLADEASHRDASR